MVIEHNLLVGFHFAQDSCMPDDNDFTSVTSITLKHTLINRLGKFSYDICNQGNMLTFACECRSVGPTCDGNRP